MSELQSPFSFLRWVGIGLAMVTILSVAVASIFIVSAGVEWFFRV